ncbi:uncharacterized protein [Paramisgurnus dabryanus]|uniref:uncharacterized protein isoform X1 n=1 Tax=Paramisgurnus dabryanus TaxID=90735 RepID=UPI0031F37C16
MSKFLWLAKPANTADKSKKMKKAIQVAKQKINEQWKVANNFCKLVNSGCTCSEIFLVTYITYFTAEDCSAAVQTSSAAANVPHLSVSQSLKGPKDSSAAVQTSAAADVPHLSVLQSLKGPKDSSAAVQTSSAAANDPHLPVSQSIRGPKDSSAAVQTSSAAANVPHLPVSQSLKGPKDSSAAVQPLLQQPMSLICLSHNHLKVQKNPVLCTNLFCSRK